MCHRINGLLFEIERIGQSIYRPGIFNGLRVYWAVLDEREKRTHGSHLTLFFINPM